MTFSILARCPETGRIGAAVASCVLAVGPRIVLARAGVGAVAVQAGGWLHWRQRILTSLADGASAQQAVMQLSNEAGYASSQIAALDVGGAAFAVTGTDCEGFAGQISAEAVTVQANTMVSDEVWPAMLDAFHSETRPLEHRLVAALRAGDEIGGDFRGRQSAAVMVVSADPTYVPTGDGDDPTVDLRVDDAADPVDDLARLVIVRDAHQELIKAGMSSQPDQIAAHMDLAYATAPDDPVVASHYAQHAVFTDEPERALVLARAAQRVNPNALNMLERRVSAAARAGNVRASAFLDTIHS